MTTRADELVAAWALGKFRRAQSTTHLAQCPSARVVVGCHGWVCDCYSTYTRDDHWEVEFTVMCDHDESRRSSAYPLGEGLPQMLQELIELDEEGFTCSHDGL